MSEEYLPISNLNDFIFCPVSIYFHSLDYDSDRIADINNKFIKEFDDTDSVYVFKMSGSCEILKYGYASHEDDTLLIV